MPSKAATDLLLTYDALCPMQPVLVEHNEAHLDRHGNDSRRVTLTKFLLASSECTAEATEAPLALKFTCSSCTPNRFLELRLWRSLKDMAASMRAL